MTVSPQHINSASASQQSCSPSREGGRTINVPEREGGGRQGEDVARLPVQQQQSLSQTEKNIRAGKKKLGRLRKEKIKASSTLRKMWSVRKGRDSKRTEI